ncbi:MAG: GDSL-type esterase/lipase family protein [Gammaproteobacteria bacterium]
MQRTTEPVQKANNRVALVKFYIVSLVIGLSLAFVAGELFVRIIIPSNKLWTVSQSNIYQSVAEPGIFYTHKPDLDRVAFGVDLRTNSVGFRGPEWDTEKGKATDRVVLIGDSHAFGFGVPYKDSVGEVLAAILADAGNRPVQVLNFGVNAYNSQQELAVFQQYAFRFDPDLIVLMVSANDHEPERRVDSDGWMYRKRRSTGAWTRSFDKSVDAAEPGEFPRWMRHSHLALYLGVARQQFRFRRKQAKRQQNSPSHSATGWPPQVTGMEISERLRFSVYEPVRQMVRLCNTRKVPIVLAYYATDVDYGRMINRLERDEEIPVVNLLSLFPEVHSLEELASKFSLGWDRHLNAEGHRRWAQAIAEVIKGRGYPRANRVGAK